MMGLSRCCLTAWWWGSLSRPVDVLGELALDRMLLWVLDMLSLRASWCWEETRYLCTLDLGAVCHAGDGGRGVLVVWTESLTDHFVLVLPNCRHDALDPFSDIGQWC